MYLEAKTNKFIIHLILLFAPRFQEVFKSKGFAELSEESMVEILKSDGLQMDESKILKFLRDWAQVNSVC